MEGPTHYVSGFKEIEILESRAEIQQIPAESRESRE